MNWVNNEPTYNDHNIWWCLTQTWAALHEIQFRRLIFFAVAVIGRPILIGIYVCTMDDRQKQQKRQHRHHHRHCHIVTTKWLSFYKVNQTHCQFRQNSSYCFVVRSWYGDRFLCVWFMD